MANAVKRWTLQEFHSLPDDGNQYEDGRAVGISSR